MAENSKISWTDHTWNPWRGCQHAFLPDGSEHPGCGNCYAEAMAKRNPKSLGVWGPDGTRVMAVDKTFNAPLKWEKEAACNCNCRIDYGERHLRGCPQKNRPRVFVDSMCDVFEDWQGLMFNHKGESLYLDIETDKPTNQGTISEYPHQLPFLRMNDVRARVFSIIDQCPNIDFLLLTKRPENIRRMTPINPHASTGSPGQREPMFYRPNVWLLTSVSDQATANEMVPQLLKSRDLVPVLGVSAEPLLGPVNFTLIKAAKDMDCDSLRGEYRQWCEAGVDHPAAEQMFPDGPKLDWIITGGESGPNARPHSTKWSQSIGKQCHSAGACWFHKQHGSYVLNFKGICPHCESEDWGCFDSKPGDCSVSNCNRCERNVSKLRDKSGANPEEWGEGWLQQIPIGIHA